MIRTGIFICRSTPASGRPARGGASTRSGSGTSIEAINGIGHAAVATDPEFRAVLAAHGFTLDPETSEIRELAPYVGAFSARTAQIRRNVDRYEAAWRSRAPRRGARSTAARGVGPAGVGTSPPRQGRTRPTAPSSWPAGTPSCAISATATRPNRCRWRGRGRGGSTAMPPPSWSSPSSGRRGRPGTPPTSAGRPRSSSPRPASSPTGPPGSSSPKTSPPGRPTGASSCSSGTDVPEHVRSLSSPQVLEVEADLISPPRSAVADSRPPRPAGRAGPGAGRPTPRRCRRSAHRKRRAAGGGRGRRRRRERPPPCVPPSSAGPPRTPADGGDPDAEGSAGRRRRDRR